MKKLFVLLAFTLSSYAVEPEDLRIQGAMTKLPLSISVVPEFQYKREDEEIFYSYPVKTDSPTLTPVRSENGWWKFRKKMKTTGLGVRIPVDMVPGLAIYKGHSETSYSHVLSRTPASQAGIFPGHLKELMEWNQGDSSSSQKYGGIIARISFHIAGLPSISAVVGIQNLFRLSLRKLEDRKVEFIIAEEKMTERMIRTSMEMIRLSFAKMKNKKLSFRFILDPGNPDHQDLFQSALKGDLINIQNALTATRQKIRWEADEKKISQGVSLVRKEVWTWTNLTFPETHEEIYMKAKTSKGKLSLKRSHVDFNLSDENGMTLHWTHKMAKMNEVRFRKFFLKPLEQMKISVAGLKSTVGMKFGKVLTEISLHLSRQRIEALPQFHGKDWNDIRNSLGVTLLNHPEKLPGLFPGNAVYVKFWSDKLQSFESKLSLGSSLPVIQSQI